MTPSPARAPVDHVGDGYNSLLGRVNGVDKVRAIDPDLGALRSLIAILNGKTVDQPDRALQDLERVGGVDAARAVHVGERQLLIIELNQFNAVLQHKQRVVAVGCPVIIEIAIWAIVTRRLQIRRGVIARLDGGQRAALPVGEKHVVKTQHDFARRSRQPAEVKTQIVDLGQVELLVGQTVEGASGQGQPKVIPALLQIHPGEIAHIEGQLLDVALTGGSQLKLASSQTEQVGVFQI